MDTVNNYTTAELTELRQRLAAVEAESARIRKAANAVAVIWKRDGCTMPAIWRTPMQRAVDALARAVDGKAA